MVQSSVLCKQNKSSNITLLWDTMTYTSVKKTMSHKLMVRRYHTSQINMPENSDVHGHQCENIKSHRVTQLLQNFKITYIT